MKSLLFSFPGLALWASLALTSLVTEAAELKHAKLMGTESDGIPGRYIVQFKKDNHLTGNTFTQSVEQALSDKDVEIVDTIHHRFFNGASIKVDDTDALKTVLNRPDVQAVYPVQRFYHTAVAQDRQSVQKRAEKTDAAAPNMALALGQVDKVHAKLGYKGKGAFIGIIDSGLDYKHPALGGGFGKGYKVAAGYDLVGDEFDFDLEPKPDEDPYDSCTTESSISSHATHVAGIVAGYSKEDGFTGVAPEATLGIWRVFGCQGSTSTDVLVKAMLMAYDAGVDIITMSIGSNPIRFGYESVESQVARQLIDKGIYFVNSAGNDGRQSIFSVGHPARHQDLLSVGAMTGVKTKVGYFKLSSGLNKTVEMLGTQTVYPKNGELVLGDAGIDDLAPGCDLEDIPDNVKGKVVIIRVGACKIGRKATVAAAKGAISLIVYDDGNDDLNIKNAPTEIPAVVISKVAGEEIVATLKAGKKLKIKFYPEDVSMAIENESKVASFSSAGPNSGIHLVPRIAAYGDQVNSTFPLRRGGYGIMSGTSMSTPYVAGTLALYINSVGKEKKRPFEDVIESLQNYARPSSMEYNATIDSPLRQGAGMVQIYDTLTQGVHVSPSQISFNDTASTDYKTQTVTITNRGSKTVQFDVKNDASIGISMYETEDHRVFPLRRSQYYDATAKLDFSTDTLKLSPGASQNITITVTPPTEGTERYIFYGGYVRLQSKQQKNNIDVRIPYIGVNNDLSQISYFWYYGETNPKQSSSKK